MRLINFILLLLLYLLSIHTIIAASDTQMNDAEIVTERAIMSRIYKLALYPNDEADVARDRWVGNFHNHIKLVNHINLWTDDT